MLSKLVARWLLPASLALNVFFAVVVFMHYQHFHAGPPDPMHVADRMAADLSPLDGAILQQAFTSRAPAMTEARRRMADFSEQMRDTLEAAPFDPDRLKAVLENGRAVREGLDMATASAFVEAASKISPEGRKALASRPAPPPGSRPPPRPGFGPPPGPPPGFASPSLLDPGPPPPR